MLNIDFKKATTILTGLSMILIVSCSGDSKTSDNLSSNSGSVSNGSCQLDSMVDDYQTLADKLKKAMNDNDFNTIMSINQDVLKWQQKWEAAANSATDCSLNEITSATDRMLSIEQSLIK